MKNCNGYGTKANNAPFTFQQKQNLALFLISNAKYILLLDMKRKAFIYLLVPAGV